jgi:predicted ATPase/class 3 adenylate cyclase/DNA-binding CsgD family transcriptional regulator
VVTRALPTGTVTFLFTDVESSSHLWERYPEAMPSAVARHDTLIEQAVEAHRGHVVRQRSEAERRFTVFARATEAVAAAAAIQQALHAEVWPGEVPLRVRLAVHTGEADLRDGDYYGTAVRRCAQMRALAHGGQVLVSEATHDLIRDAPLPGLGLKDVGARRLRDLTRPERVYQLLGPGLPDDFPELRSLDRLPNNLPIQATPFIGREQQLAAVCAPLERGDVRLLTLTGPGGTGKTRLALQAAADLLDSFSDGVFFVSLAPLSDPELVPSAIAQALDLKETGGRPLVESLQDFLRGKRVLLVLDNFEHVLAAAPVVRMLLGAEPSLSVLVTSRAVLRLYGEHDFPVPPLALPDHGAGVSAAYVARFEAARLFLERAHAARPSFAFTDANAPLVAALCRRLEGLPLALELAAARLRVLPLPALVDRLEHSLPLLTGGARDLPVRQQTLRNTIAWSYDLLDPDEQALFRWLSVFRGFTLEAAEALCRATAAHPRSTSVALPPLSIDVLDGITRLVDQSLLRQEDAEDGQPWYVMAETIREYAAERLVESGDAPAIQRRHILHYLRLVESADPELHGPQQKQWLVRLEREHNNLRAALDSCWATGYAEPAYRIALVVWWFWLVHGHMSEGRERLARLLDRFPAAPGADERANQRAAMRARTLYAVGHLSCGQGDYTAARRFQEEALAIRRVLGDPVQVAAALEPLGTAAALQGDYDVAQRAFREALAIARTLSNPYMTAMSLHDLANVLHEQGDYATAGELADEAIVLLREVGDTRALGSGLLTRALIAQAEGDYDTAQRLAEEALDLYEEAGDSRSVALGLANLGSLATVRGDQSVARQRLGASLAMFEDLADTASIAAVIQRFSELEAARSNYLAAVRLAGAAEALRRAAGVSLSPTIRAKLDASLAPARRALGEAAAEAWRGGQALSLPEALAAALAAPEPPLVAARRTESTARIRPERVPAYGLTAREQEVAGLIARGLTNRQIGETLVITEGTAASHVVHILDKLGFSSRAQIAIWAAERGLLQGTTA